MSVVSSFPRQVREIETCWIPLSDGTRLAARIWLPEDALQDPVPAILEYIPYRRRDGTRDGDELTHPYFAGHGYAAIRLDIRGSGDSEGVIRDEYLKQEQDDALEAIAWIAAQPWCSGRVGMMGISWGGFNSLQVAARRPPALKAIITACSTDDRYADDMHYMGGCLVTDNLAWGAYFFSIMARPPDPLVVGDKWREMWRQRLDAVEPAFAGWMEHPTRDEFWRHGSVAEDFGAIECAVLAVGGWADGYRNAVFRLLNGLGSPCLGIVGPWGHKYPHNGVPGPAIGFLQEALRWWDHWLKGSDTGIMNEPILRAYIEDSVPPKSHYAERPGRWVAEDAWPSANIVSRRLVLNPGRIDSGAPAKPGETVEMTVKSPQTLGALAGEWCPYGLGGLGPELPLDQRAEDGQSLCFDSGPLTERLEILGAPAVLLQLAADRPGALVCVRLNDVAPDGASTRVTYGVLNLTHRASHAEPTPLVPGQVFAARVQLNDTGFAFPPGHRLRIAVSTAYWPIVWPAPDAATLVLHAGACFLDLPVRPPRPEDAAVAFGPPETAPPLARKVLRPGLVTRTLETDVATGMTVNRVLRDDGASIIEAIGVETDFVKTLAYRIHPDEPASARAEATHRFVYRRGDWHPRIETMASVACDKEAFHVAADLSAYEGDVRVFSRSWTRRIPRRQGH